jgi:hypothetical protein
LLPAALLLTDATAAVSNALRVVLAIEERQERPEIQVAYLLYDPRPEASIGLNDVLATDDR